LYRRYRNDIIDKTYQIEVHMDQVAPQGMESTPPYQLPYTRPSAPEAAFDPALLQFIEQQRVAAEAKKVSSDLAAEAQRVRSDDGGMGDNGGGTGIARATQKLMGTPSSTSGDAQSLAGGGVAYARGGSTPRGIAALGRGKDTMLVHMTPGEVRGLQQLALAHGGSLTINPHTGLVEAGFLSSMLPMLVGAALTATGVGAPIAALMVGGGYGLATGSLKKGLMAGLGAYGGANLGAGLGELGAESLSTEAARDFSNTLGTEGSKVATDLGQQAYDTALKEVSSGKITPEYLQNAGMTPERYAQQFREAAENSAPMPDYTTPNPKAVPKYADMDMAQRAQAMQKGLGSVNPFSDTFNKTAASSFLDKNKYQVASAFAGPAMEAMKPQSMTPMKPEPDQYDRELAKYHLAPNYQPYVAPRPNPYYSAVYAAEGGDVSRMAGGGKTLSRKPDIPDVGIIPLDDITTASLSPNEAALIRMQAAARRANLTPYTPEKIAIKGLGDIGPPTSMLANGGIAALPSEYAAGGKLLQGPGDGMSDSIPAVIKGPRPQRAALAQGEFVVPADVVSHLGNGSTDAGAKRLYAMMNNIRKARTGTKKQGKQINAAHFMPA